MQMVLIFWSISDIHPIYLVVQLNIIVMTKKLKRREGESLLVVVVWREGGRV